MKRVPSFQIWSGSGTAAGLYGAIRLRSGCAGANLIMQQALDIDGGWKSGDIEWQDGRLDEPKGWPQFGSGQAVQAPT